MKIYTPAYTLEVRGDALESVFPDLTGKESLAGTEASWDLAYQIKLSARKSIRFVEPNLENKYQFNNPAFPDEPKTLTGTLELTSSSLPDVCSRNNDYDRTWPYPSAAGIEIPEIWHLKDTFSQLKKARDSFTPGPDKVRIAHFDTGYDPALTTYPADLINHHLERNFVEEETPLSAVDHYSTGWLNQPGHGSGTLSILAGAYVDLPQYDFHDTIGLARAIEVIPIRISKSVILFRNQAFTRALNYIIDLYDDPSTRCHIVTMSMGGLASKEWADAVNRAYDKGIFIVTAAGNNFGRATPGTVVFPARFRRVVAACGVTCDFSPYYKPFDPVHPFQGMQGNFGPRTAMTHAMAAFTPNMPWAKIGCRDVVSLGGAGTSSATPQIAAAAALYLQKYFTLLEGWTEGWKKVEAIRYALFHSAAKKIVGQPTGDLDLYFGNGILQADAMLDITPDLSVLAAQEQDSVHWPLFKLLTGTNLEAVELAQPEDSELEEMMELEVLQLIQQSPELQDILHREERSIDDLGPDEKINFIHTLRGLPLTSSYLKEKLKGY